MAISGDRSATLDDYLELAKEVTAPDFLQKYAAMNRALERLRLALLHEWEYNHGEHCGGDDCGVFAPDPLPPGKIGCCWPRHPGRSEDAGRGSAMTVKIDDERTGMTWLTDALRHFFCGLLHGHDELPQFEHGRMYLLCVSCGRETAGWQIAARRS